MLAARRANIPYILTFHSAGHSSSMRNALRGLQLMALRPLLAHAKKLVAVTDFEASFFLKRLRLPAEQFIVIPNGMYLPETLKTGEDTPRKPGEGFLVVSIGRLERYKGHQHLIAALPRIREHIPDVSVRIVGAGPYKADLLRMARELGVADRVEVRAVPPEDRNGMLAVLAQADLVTLFSAYESQGLTILEALALQRPVLVADTSALREFVERGLARAVSPACAPEEVACAVVQQLRQPLRPGDVRLPTWDDCSRNLLSLYTTVVGETLCVS
jgi:glycosyltransferase involved in cell wall biosynthesis